jgi:hypothetical protein
MPTVQQLTDRLEDLYSELEALRYYRRKKLITARAFASQKAKILRSIEVAEDRLYDAKLKEAKKKALENDLKKRTYVLTQDYTREKLAFTLRGTYGGEYRVLPEATSTHTHTEQFVRRKGESMASFQRRANERGRAVVIEMDTDMGEGGETIFQHKANGGATLSAGGGGGMGMTRSKPWAYENSGFYSIAEEGKCVPNSLKQLYPKRTYDYFVRNLFPNSDDSVPCLAEWVYNWAVKCDITVLGCDEFYHVLRGRRLGCQLNTTARTKITSLFTS